MTKIEKLKAAYEDFCNPDAYPIGYEGKCVTFRVLSDQMMPQLLEAVRVLKEVPDLLDLAFNYEGNVFGIKHNDATDIDGEIRAVLESLK